MSYTRTANFLGQTLHLKKSFNLEWVKEIFLGQQQINFYKKIVIKDINGLIFTIKNYLFKDLV